MNVSRSTGLPTVPLTYEVEARGNRYYVMACRGEVRAHAWPHGYETEAEAQQTADRLTKRSQELNQR